MKKNSKKMKTEPEGIPTGEGELQMLGVKVPPRIVEMIQDAERKTGKTKTALVNRLIENHIKQVTEEMMREEFERLAGEIDRLKTKPSK